MTKVFGKYGLLMAIAGVFVFANGAGAQDLGSSSGIFRSPNPSSKSSKSKTSGAKSAKKTAPKTGPKTSSKTPAKTTPNQRTTTRSTELTSTPRENVSKTNKPPIVVEPSPRNDLIITVGNQTTGNFDEMLEQAVDEGNIARDDRDYIRAESAYRRAQNLKSKDSRAVYGLGNIYADQQRWEEAERSYRQAISLEPDSAGAFIALSYVLTQPIGVNNLSDRYDEAETIARKAIQLDPKNAFAHDQLGVALELRGIISAETQAAYQKAIQIDPQFALAYAHLGRLLRRNGKTNESTDAYRKAIEYSTDVPTMILVAEVMQSQQRFSESERLLRSALSVDSKHPTALFMLGRALTTRAEYDEAEKVLKKSVEVSPNSYVSYTLLSSLYVRRARLDEAEKTLNKALTVVSPSERRRLAPEFEAIGDALMKAGRPQDAQRLYRQAMSLDASKTILTEKLSRSR